MRHTEEKEKTTLIVHKSPSHQSGNDLRLLTFGLLQQFNIQLTNITLKNVELLNHFKISKTAPTCFGLLGNHYQGATVST